MEPLTKRERSYFNAAKSVSSLSDFPRVKLGCVIVKNHRIISSGFNSKTKTHRIQAELDKEEFGVDSSGPVHAELSAMIPFINRRTDLSDATVYIYREHGDGHTAMARPCSRCMKMIKELGIRRIKYSTDEGFAYEIIQ